jgi:hypothetical protein
VSSSSSHGKGGVPPSPIGTNPFQGLVGGPPLGCAATQAGLHQALLAGHTAASSSQDVRPQPVNPFAGMTSSTPARDTSKHFDYVLDVNADLPGLGCPNDIGFPSYSLNGASGESIRMALESTWGEVCKKRVIPQCDKDKWPTIELKAASMFGFDEQWQGVVGTGYPEWDDFDVEDIIGTGRWRSRRYSGLTVTQRPMFILDDLILGAFTYAQAACIPKGCAISDYFQDMNIARIGSVTALTFPGESVDFPTDIFHSFRRDRPSCDLTDYALNGLGMLVRATLPLEGRSGMSTFVVAT